MRYLLNTCFAAGRTIGLWHAGFTEIFLSKNVGSNLAPLPGHFYVIHFKHHLAARIANDAGTIIILKLVVRIYSFFCEATLKLQPRVSLCTHIEKVLMFL